MMHHAVEAFKFAAAWFVLGALWALRPTMIVGLVGSTQGLQLKTRGVRKVGFLMLALGAVAFTVAWFKL